MAEAEFHVHELEEELRVERDDWEAERAGMRDRMWSVMVGAFLLMAIVLAFGVGLGALLL